MTAVQYMAKINRNCPKHSFKNCCGVVPLNECLDQIVELNVFFSGTFQTRYQLCSTVSTERCLTMSDFWEKEKTIVAHRVEIGTIKY